MDSKLSTLQHSLKIYDHGYQPESTATVIDIVQQQVKIGTINKDGAEKIEATIYYSC